MNWKRGRASAEPIAASMVITSEIATALSIDQIAPRADAASAAGSPAVRITNVRYAVCVSTPSK
jgi:hypothetical protein